MSTYIHALIWAAAMLLIAFASRLGLIDDRVGDFMLMVALAAWVATAPKSGRGTCGLRRLWS